jgi:hypothetical protein
MQKLYGRETFNIIPETYILPIEFPDFYAKYHKNKGISENDLWIVKPQNSS